MALRQPQSAIIRNYLVDLAQNRGLFFPASIDPETNLMQISTDPIPPSSVTCNEISATYAVSNDMVAYTLEKKEWYWLLKVEFPASIEVVFDFFEDELARSVVITKDTQTGVTLLAKLKEAKYTHPPAHQASKGTRAEFTFLVDQQLA